MERWLDEICETGGGEEYFIIEIDWKNRKVFVQK